MATTPNPLQGPLPSLPPVANPLVGGPPLPPPQPLPQSSGGAQSPPESEVYKIDPLVLDKAVKIKITGSSRMVTKDILAQQVQFLAQFISNGPFLQQLMQAGQAVDFPTFFEMLQDATGTTRMYPIIRPLNQQEEQRLQQPPPQGRMIMQKAQLDAQTRTQMGQMKADVEKQKDASRTTLENKRIDEESARHMLDLMEQQRQSNDPVEQKKAMLELQAKAQEHHLNQQAKLAEHHLNFAAQAHQQRLEAHKATQQALLDHQAAQQKAVLDHQAAHLQNAAKVHSILAQGRAQADAAKMMPKKPASEKT